MAHVSVTEFRRNLAHYLDQVDDSRAPLVVTRQNADPVIVIAESEWMQMQEWMHLLGTPVNAVRLLRSMAELESGQGISHDLIEVTDHATRLES